MKTGKKLGSLFLCGLASCLTLAHCQAQEGIISSAQANRSGLVVQWFSQLDATDAEAIVDLALVVDEDRATTYFQISGGRLSETFSEFDLNPFGKPYGVEGGKNFAEIRKEIMQAQLKRDLVDAEVKIEQYTIPESTLFTITSTGVLNAVNAENGELRWRLTIGDRRLPVIGMGANKTHVAVVDGTNVYCIESRTGKVTWSQTLKSSIAGSPAVNDQFVFVPMDDGRLQALPVESRGYGQSTYVALGTPLSSTAPKIEGQSVAWSTSKGVTVAPSNEMKSMRFRLETDSPVVCAPAAQSGIFFVASQRGFIYAVAEKDSDLLWQYPTGERISKSPIPLGDDLFVITDSRNLYRFDSRTGTVKPGWEHPMADIVQFVGAGENHLYVLDSLGKLVTIDRDSGTILGRVSSNLSLRTFSNVQSDRLYVCHETGLIQCLREPGSDRPKFHSGEMTEIVKADTLPANKSDSGAETSTSPFDTGNPFGGGSSAPDASNPFGGGAPAMPNNDPFSGGGAGSTPPSDDPFGGGATNPPAGGNMQNTDPFSGGATGNSNSGASDDPFSSGGGAAMPNNASSGGATDASKVTLWKDVQTVFKKRCDSCHGSQKQQGGFDTSSLAAVMKGGDSGSPVTAGDVNGSRLYQLITHADEPTMPPGNKKIPDADIKLIEAWIAGGALETAPAAGSNPPADSSDPFAGG